MFNATFWNAIVPKKIIFISNGFFTVTSVFFFMVEPYKTKYDNKKKSLT